MKKIIFISLFFVFSYYGLKAQCDAHAGQDQAVCGLTVVPSAYFTSGGYSGQWSYLDGPCTNPVFLNATQPNCHINVCQYGIYRFIWTIFEDANPSNMCKDTITVEFIERPLISAGPDQWVCGDTVYLHAISPGTSVGKTWMTAPVTWFDLSTHVADTSAQWDPITIAHHIHTVNDSVIFQWLEYNLSTLQTIQNTMTCVSHDTMIVHFFEDHPAVEFVDSQWDTIQCGGVYTDLNAQYPPEGYGYWIESTGTANFFPNANTILASAIVNTYGMRYFYWVTQNGTRPNGTPVCKDTSEVIPIRFIEMPVANAGGNSHNWGNGSELKTDTVCGHTYPLNPLQGGIGIMQWQLPFSPNFHFISTNTNTSPLPNDSLYSSILGSSYAELYLQIDNSVIPYAPYSHGCIDRDTIRIWFQNVSSVTGNLIYSGSLSDQFTAELYNTAGPNGWHLSQSTPVTGNSFTFLNVELGNYAVKINNETMGTNVLSTYYDSTISWQQAFTFNVECNNTYPVNVHMQTLPNTTGSGSASGTILYDIGNTKITGEPISGVNVYLQLEPDDEFVKHTLTNDSGYFHITNIPNGIYSVLVDIPGLPQITTYNFSVTNTDLNFPNINFVVDTNSAISKDYGFGIYADTSMVFVKNISASENNILVYPNPVNDFVKIQMQLDKPEQLSIEILDILGRKYYEFNNSEIVSGNVIKTIDMRSLQSGTYIMKVTSNNKTNSFNLIR